MLSAGPVLKAAMLDALRDMLPSDPRAFRLTSPVEACQEAARYALLEQEYGELLTASDLSLSDDWLLIGLHGDNRRPGFYDTELLCELMHRVGHPVRGVSLEAAEQPRRCA